MRIDPLPEDKSIRAVKSRELNQLIARTTQVAAIIVAFASVFFFFFKILYF